MSAAPGAPPRWLLFSLAVGVNVVWALSYPVTKVTLVGLSPLALTCWRLAGAAVLLLPWAGRFPRPPRARDLALLAAMSLIGCAAASLLQFAGTVRSTASNIALITGVETLLISVLARAFLSEPLPRRSLLALLLAFAGVVLVTVDPTTLELTSSRFLAGNGLMLASVTCYAGYTVMGKALAPRWNAGALTALPFLVSALVLVPYFAVSDPPGFVRALALTRGEAGAVAFLVGGVTAGGYLLWNWLLGYLDASELGFSLYVQPVAGALFSAWLLGEAIGATFVSGTALVLGAVALRTSVPRFRWRRRPEAFLSRGE
jgi:drug/metabolite transporter (DMT)-like permease